MKSKALSSLLTLLLITAVFVFGIFGLNSFTAPIIEANRSAADTAPLLAVIPESKGFEMLYDASAPENTELKDIPETVQGIYAESSGLGFALKLSTSEGYTGEPMELSLGIDPEGKICGVSINSYADTKDLDAEYTGGFIGQDSTLADVGLVSGVTYSCTAFKNAVADGFEVLTTNSLVSAGQKSDEQLLMEIAGAVFPGMANYGGTLQYEELQPSEDVIKAFKALNGSSYSAIVPFNDGSCLVTVNLSGDVMAINAEGESITDSLDPALLEKIKAEASQNLSSFAEKDQKRFSRMLSESAEFEELPLKGVFNTVTTGFKVKDGGKDYIALAARSYAYSNEIMTVYCILDTDGAIVSLNAPEIIFHKEYFDAYTLDEPSYKEGFSGLTSDTFSGDEAFISGATMSTNGMKSAVNDIFEAYGILMQNGGIAHE